MWIIIRLLIGIAVLATVEYYFLKNTGNSVKVLFPTFFNKYYKKIKVFFLVWVNLYPLVLIGVFVYASITSIFVSQPENIFYDYLLVYPFWILFMLMIQVSLFFLLIDLFKLILFPIYKKRKEKLRSLQARLILAIVLFFVVYIPIRVIYDYNNVSVRIVEYKKNNLEPSLNDFKIAFISDIQADRYTDKKRVINFINEVNSLGPDLVLIAGDLITTGPKYINTSAELVGKLNSKYGVYSCVGDHDNWAYREDNQKSVREIIKALNNQNVKMIDNQKRTIDVNGAQIEITFVTNTYVGKISEQMLDSLSSNGTGDLKIFLTHQPRQNLIDSAVENNYDLFLAGHTHGGQITFHFPFIALTPTMFETKYVRGDFHFGDMLMVVTRGLGMSLAPLRYNSTPEVTLIVLQNKI